jgi:hypothetical protein
MTIKERNTTMNNDQQETSQESADWLLRDHPEMMDLMCRQLDALHDLLEAQTMERFALQKQLVRSLRDQGASHIDKAGGWTTSGVIVYKPDAKVDDQLPPMQPVPGKRVKSRDVKCPTCVARPGEGCFRMSSRGPSATPTDEPLVAPGSGKPMMHKRRTEAAKEMSRGH